MSHATNKQELQSAPNRVGLATGSPMSAKDYCSKICGAKCCKAHDPIISPKPEALKPLREKTHTMDANTKEPTPTHDGCCASRMQGKSVLKDIIHRLRRRADDLQALHDMLPEKPTPEQDEALWQIAVSMERR